MEMVIPYGILKNIRTEYLLDAATGVFTQCTDPL